MDYFQFEGSDDVFRGVTAPDRYFDCKDSRERTASINRNLRAIMQLFNIRVIVYPERVEIKGAIPTQVLDKSAEFKTGTAPIIISPSPGKGDFYIREAKLLFNTLF